MIQSKDELNAAYSWLAPGPRELLWKALQENSDAVIEGADFSEQQKRLLLEIARRERRGLRSQPGDFFK